MSAEARRAEATTAAVRSRTPGRPRARLQPRVTGRRRCRGRRRPGRRSGPVRRRRSSVYETGAVGGPEQDAYLNAVLVVETDLDAHAGCWRRRTRSRQQHGRVRAGALGTAHPRRRRPGARLRGVGRPGRAAAAPAGPRARVRAGALGRGRPEFVVPGRGPGARPARGRCPGGRRRRTRLSRSRCRCRRARLTATGWRTLLAWAGAGSSSAGSSPGSLRRARRGGERPVVSGAGAGRWRGRAHLHGDPDPRPPRGQGGHQAAAAAGRRPPRGARVAASRVGAVVGGGYAGYVVFLLGDLTTDYRKQVVAALLRSACSVPSWSSSARSCSNASCASPRTPTRRTSPPDAPVAPFP